MVSRWPIDSAELATLEASEDYRRHGTLLYDIHETSRVVSAHFDAMMKPGNLTRAEWWAIMEIVRNEGSSQSEIARKMNIGRSATGKLMARLEAKGWIVREVDPDDARAMKVFSSRGIVAAYEAMGLAAAQQFNELLEGVSKEEETLLITLLARIRTNAARRGD